MKKFAAGLFACAVILCSMTAFADESAKQDIYFGSDESVHVGDYNGINGNAFTTVVIRESGTEDANSVVYADQQSDGLGDVMNFMLKDGVPDGNYTATFGNGDGETKSINFKVGNLEYETVTLKPENKMSVIDEPVSTDDETFKYKEGQGFYKKGFMFTTKMDSFDKFNAIYLIYADGTSKGKIDLYDKGAHKKPSFTGDAEVVLGVQIYNIPEASKGMNLYLGEGDAQ